MAINNQVRVRQWFVRFDEMIAPARPLLGFVPEAEPPAKPLAGPVGAAAPSPSLPPG